MTGRGKKKKSKKPGTEDDALWRSAMQDVRPIQKDEEPEEPEPPEEAVETESETGNDAPPPQPSLGIPAETQEPPPAAGIDKRTGERLRRGQIPIEGTLDLHGHSKVQAHGELAHFIEAGYEQGKRCLLVVTGKGGSVRQEEGDWFEPEAGVLKKQVPRWLAEPPLAAKVITFAPAQPKHGGDGALYVYLRRKKKRGV